MPGKKKISSVRSKREIDQLFLESFEATKKAIDLINQQLKSGKGLTDEQFRFLKKAPQLISSYRAREEIKEEEEEGITDEKLKTMIDTIWRLKDIGPREVVVEATGYYRCSNCGDIHKLGEECIFEQYLKIKKEEAKEESNNH